MAILNKPDIQLLVDAYTIKVDTVIVANGVGAITGPILNDVLQDSIEILTDIKDSYYNLLSETRTAVSTTYDNTATNLLWEIPVPVNTQEAIDKLITKINTDTSINIAYIKVGGIDIEAEVGNPLKPFGTFLAAWDAMPSNNFIIKSLGGTFNVGTTILSSKLDFLIDLSGTTITGVEFRLATCLTGFVNLQGGTMNAYLNVGASSSDKISVFGGEINNRLNIRNESFVSSCRITNSSNALTIESTTEDKRPFISNCRIVSTAGFGVGGGAVGNFSNCYIEGDITAFNCPTSETNISKFVGCNLKAKGAANLATLYGTNGVLNGNFKQCRIESTVGIAVWVGGSTSLNLFFEDCEIISETDCVHLQNTLSRPLINTKTTFKRCSFYTATGEIFVQPNPFLNGAALGVTSLIGTTFTNKALLPLGVSPNLEKFEVLGDQITDVNAQTPSF